MNREAFLRIKKIKIFDLINHTFLGFFALTIIYPFWDLFMLSFADAGEATSLGFRFWISSWNIESYRFVFRGNEIVYAYGNTIFRTIIGTFLAVLLTFMAAYPMSKKDLVGRNVVTFFMIFTMFFSGGLIPSYLLVRSLGLINSRWALIVPGAFNVFYFIIARNFIKSLGTELEESALIDGAGYATILVKIIMPICKPVLATIALWSAVGHWNAWFDALIYINDPNKIVLQLVVRRFIDYSYRQLTDMQEHLSELDLVVPIASANIKAATIIITIGPIVIVYPFAQKYFVKGIMIGSLKG